jgi:hypothetical protein
MTGLTVGADNYAQRTLAGVQAIVMARVESIAIN